MTTPESCLREWSRKMEQAEQMLPLIGRLYRDQGVVVTIFGRPLVHCSTIEIIKQHRFARQILPRELALEETLPLLAAMEQLSFCPTRVDLGKLANAYAETGGSEPVEAFVRRKLTPHLSGPEGQCPSPRDVVLYGFGRIGRLLTRLLVENSGAGGQLRLRAVVVRKGSGSDLEKRASLLRRDSVHGPFNGTVRLDREQNAIIANGHFIRFIDSSAPESMDYTAYGIHDALVIDNTGAWRDRAGLERHLQAKGVSQVVLTAPGKGDLPNIVFGLNQELVTPEERIYSAASCTTNAAAPVVKAIHDRFGIRHGHIETCHSYTNDQNLIDNYHKSNRRGRSAPLNMVITETGAAKAVGKVIPELAGKLTGNAIRVPTPNVSLAILNLQLAKETTTEEVNEYLRHIALDSPLQEQIDFVASPEVVSSDFVGSRYAGVVDALATTCLGRQLILYVWYDNEFGYSTQVIRLAEQIAGCFLRDVPI